MAKRMALCYKCSNRILADHPTDEGAKILIGCKADPKIKDWHDAQAMCYILKNDDDSNKS